MPLFRKKSIDIGIDLGTSSLEVFVKGKGLVLQEPSLAAVDRRNGSLLCVGEKARAMLGRTPPEIAVVKPLENGVISNTGVTASMLRFFFTRLGGMEKRDILRAVICVPSGITEAERRSVAVAAQEAGAKKCFMIEEPIAAAIGAGLDISSGHGIMVVDIGGGTTDIAIISFGSVVLSDSLRIAGDAFDAALALYMKRKHNLVIGAKSAEDLKIAYGRACTEPEQEIVEIRGRDLISGLPSSVPVGTNELCDATAMPVAQIMEAVRTLFEQTPPELAGDILKEGILLTGGGAQLRGLDRYIREAAGVPCRLAEDPTNCVVNGIGKVLQDPTGFSGTLKEYHKGEFFALSST